MAALVQSTEVPRVQNPCLSGVETWIKATSKSIRFLRNSHGISDRNTETTSARPSFTACLRFTPVNKELDLMTPKHSIHAKSHNLKQWHSQRGGGGL